MRERRFNASLLLSCALLTTVSGCATDANDAVHHAKPTAPNADVGPAVSRQVTIHLNDDRSVSPAWFKANEGDVVRLIVVNESDAHRAFTLGSQDALKQRLDRFTRASPRLQDASSTVEIAPHQRTELTVQLRGPTRVYYTCVEFGPYADSTSGYIAVAPHKLDQRRTRVKGS